MMTFGLRRSLACLALFLVLPAAVGAAAAADTVVRKVVEPFDQVAWPTDAWVRAAGSSRLVDDLPPNSPPGKSLKIEVRFSGKGFEWSGVAPAEPLVIPGELKTVTLDYQLSDQRYVMEFRLPVAELQNFQPRAGARLGLNLNLTIKGGQYNRELYWPAPKEARLAANPGLWGSLELRTPE